MRPCILMLILCSCVHGEDGGHVVTPRKNPNIEAVRSEPGQDGEVAASAILTYISERISKDPPFDRPEPIAGDIRDAIVWTYRQYASVDTGGISTVVRRLRIVLANAKNAERDRFVAAFLLGYITDDAQSIDLIIDASQEEKATPGFRQALLEQVVSGYRTILTQAQRTRLQSDHPRAVPIP